ncbi:MAG TPA: glycosyltransferase family 4 protein [Candidatus Limnocylindrales bacterium]|nr:glycosyltransferase family 4 protein [Candidatus Limnocylindrales bacterium]
MSEKFRILQITTGTTWSGGQEQVYQLSKGLAEKGHEVTVICPPGSSLGDKLEKIHIPVERIPMRKEWDFLAVPQIIRVLVQRKVDLINAHRPTAHMLAWIATFFRKTRAFIVTRRVALPIKNPLSAKFKYRFRVSKIIAVSQSVKQVLIDSGIPSTQIEVIYSGTDLARFNPAQVDGTSFRKNLGLDLSQPLIGAIGNHSSHNFRGYSYFLEAAARILQVAPRARFILIGRGTNSQELLALSKKLHLDPHLSFLGFREDIPEALAALDILVNPALTEGFSGVIREAMAMRKPVVATRVGGNRELIQDGINGFLVPPADAHSLAEKILYLLNHKDLALNMGNQGHALVEEKFSIQKMVENTERLYEQVLQNTDNPSNACSLL